MKAFTLSILIIAISSFPADAQRIDGFDIILPSSPIHDNFYRARMASMNLVREAEPKLPEASRERAREVLTRISYVVAYSPTTNEGMKRCETFSYLYDKRDDEFYICPSMAKILRNPDDKQLTVTAQLLIGWAHYRVSPNRDPCADSEFELTIMELTSVGVLSSDRLNNELEKCGNRLARFEKYREHNSRISEPSLSTAKTKRAPSSPSWSEVILGSVLKAGQAYVDQRSQLENAQRTRQDHMQNFGSPSLQCRADECKICRNIGGQPQFQCAPRQGMSCTAAECR